MPFCKNCGAENNSGSKFCVRCGAPIEQPQADVNSAPQMEQPQADFNSVPQGDVYSAPQMEQPQNGFNSIPQGNQPQYNYGAPQGMPVQPKEKKPVNKKLIIIIAVAAVVVIALIVAAIIIVKNVKEKKEIERKTIKLEEYIEVTFEGYDTLGTASVKINYDEFYDATLKAMGKSEKTATVKVLERAQEACGSVYVSLDKTYDLSNGDEVEVDADYDKIKIKEADVIIDFDPYKVEVEGLDELEVIDIFDYVEVTYSGFDGSANVSVSNVATRDELKSVWFSTSTSYNLSIGDTFTVSVDSYYEDTLLTNYGIKLKSNSKDYTVTENDVDRYIKKLSDISDELMETLKEDALDEIDDEYYYSSDKLSEIEYYGSYLVYTGDDYDGYDTNSIYVIYTAKLTPYDDDLKPMKIYVPVKINSLVQRADGTQEYTDSWLSVSGYTYIKDTWHSFDGYDSEKTMFESIVKSCVKDYDYDYELSEGLKDYLGDDEDETVEDETTDDEESEDEKSEDETTEDEESDNVESEDEKTEDEE